MKYKIKAGTVEIINHPRVNIVKDKKAVVKCRIVSDEPGDVLELEQNFFFTMEVSDNDTLAGLQSKAEAMAEGELNKVIEEKKKENQKSKQEKKGK